MEIKNLKELQLKEYAITQPEVETLLNYLGQRPWVEVNDLMVILLRKINPANQPGAPVVSP